MGVDAFPSAAHFWIENGEPRMLAHDGRVLQSVTNIFFGANSEKVIPSASEIRL